MRSASASSLTRFSGRDIRYGLGQDLDLLVGRGPLALRGRIRVGCRRHSLHIGRSGRSYYPSNHVLGDLFASFRGNWAVECSVRHTSAISRAIKRIPWARVSSAERTSLSPDLSDAFGWNTLFVMGPYAGSEKQRSTPEQLRRTWIAARLNGVPTRLVQQWAHDNDLHASSSSGFERAVGPLRAVSELQGSRGRPGRRQQERALIRDWLLVNEESLGLVKMVYRLPNDGMPRRNSWNAWERSSACARLSRPARIERSLSSPWSEIAAPLDCCAGNSRISSRGVRCGWTPWNGRTTLPQGRRGRTSRGELDSKGAE